MRVAALYDVHGMPWALEAVLAEVGDEEVDRVVFGGDLAEGPYPARTLELARAVESALFVRGNCEREPNEWTRGALGAADVEWLQGLPATVRLDGVEYAHSTPEDDLVLLTAATTLDQLADAVRGAHEPMLVIGHTHHQFDRTAGGVRVVNAGSVGMPYEGTVAAFWALISAGVPELRHTVFDVDAAIREVESSGWPLAGEFVAENLLAAPSRHEAIASFESRRA